MFSNRKVQHGADTIQHGAASEGAFQHVGNTFSPQSHHDGAVLRVFNAWDLWMLDACTVRTAPCA